MNKCKYPLLLLLSMFYLSCGDSEPQEMEESYSCSNSSCDAPPPFIDNLVGSWDVYENTANPDAVYDFSSPAGEVTFNADGTAVGSADGFFEGLGSVDFNYGFDPAFDAMQLEFFDGGGPIFTKYITALDNDCGEIIFEQVLNVVSDQRMIFAMCRK